MIDRIQHKLIQPIQLCVTWTAYYWNLQFFNKNSFFVAVHGKEIGYRRSIVFRNMQFAVYKKASIILCVSNYTANVLRQIFPGVPESKIRVLYHGLPKMDIPDKVFTGTKLRLLSIGQWIERKSFDLLISSYIRVSRTLDIGLDIITNQDYYLPPDIDVKIYVNIDESIRLRLLSNAYVFVLLNRHIDHDFEGFGYVVLEAMHAGCPCIVGCNGGPSELVRDGIDGFVVNPEDQNQLDLSIIKMILDNGLRDRMGASSKTRARLCFTDENVADALNKYLLE